MRDHEVDLRLLREWAHECDFPGSWLSAGGTFEVAECVRRTDGFEASLRGPECYCAAGGAWQAKRLVGNLMAGCH